MKTIVAFVLFGVLCGTAESYHRRHFQDDAEFFEMMDEHENAHAREKKPHKDNHSNGHSWDYLFSGPATWGHVSSTCGGKEQSPINIDSRTLVAKTSQNIKHNFGKKANAESYGIVNNGHALQINFNANTKYRLKKNGLWYTPLQVHMHFNPFTFQGSEHTFNNKKYFAEVHIVHKRTNGKGLLVIGMFVDLGTKDSFPAKTFSKVAGICKKAGSTAKISSFSLAKLFPTGDANYQSKYAYVNYHGSLTTPPCSEIVDWIVVTGNTLSITPDLMDIFKSVRNSASGPMGGDGGNNRPVQKTGKRTVTGVVKGFF